MLKIFYNTNDLSKKLEDYLTDTVAVTLLNTESIDIGFRKPINALYFELSAFNANASVINLEYFNGAFTSLLIEDETHGLSRSGFIKWERNQSEEQKTTLHGLELYWYKLKVDVSTSALTLNGINLVFSSDKNLVEEYPNIMEFLPENKLSFINFHQSARNDIVTKVRNQGYIVNQANVLSNYKDVDQFDFLDFTQLTDASKYLVLSKIFYWISDAVDDKWYQKAKYFDSMFAEKINLFFLSLDRDDDGKLDNNERQAIQFARVERV